MTSARSPEAGGKAAPAGGSIVAVGEPGVTHEQTSSTRNGAAADIRLELRGGLSPGEVRASRRP